jgi:thiamine-monophosphate kinase
MLALTKWLHGGSVRSEFDLIQRYFTHPTLATGLGVGDDCALMTPTPGMELAISTDLLIAGKHFLPNTNPYGLGCKSASVNLSDMAAMGAQPRWVTLGVALPEVSEEWIAAFAAGFHDTLSAHQVDWVGGDTSAGPLTIAVTILGEVPTGAALRRAGALVGDDVWVSGTLGDAALGLQVLAQGLTVSDEDRALLVARLEQPTARVALGLALRGLAHAAIDVSDGLLADLGHMLDASGVGAEIFWEAIPLSPAALRVRQAPRWQEAILCGGDDYELCFSAAHRDADAVLQAAARVGVPVTPIGSMVAAAGSRLMRDAHGHPMAVPWHGFDHFAQS